MDRKDQERLLLKMRELNDSHDTTMVAAERLNPVSEYWDPERLKAEWSQVLRRSPVVVGHASQCSEPSSHVIDQLSGDTVLLVRTADGEIVGYLHPSKEVEIVESSPGVLKCTEHQTIVGAHDNRGEHECFAPIPVEVRLGLVWAILDPGASAIDVAAHLGVLDGELNGLGLGDHVFERDHLFHENLNWKSVLDGFLENYHVKFLHADSLLKYLRTNVHTFDAFGQHARLGVLKTSYEKVSHLPIADIEPLRYLNFVYHIFPNTEIGWVGDHFDVWTSFPDQVDPNRSSSRFMMLVPSDRRDEHSFWDRSAQTVLNVIPTEDFLMARLMQEGLVADAQPYQVFGRNEGALQHFHEQLDVVLGRAR